MVPDMSEMNPEKEAQVRMWIINRIAEVLTDLSDDGADDDDDALEEIYGQMQNAATLIIEYLNLTVLDSNGQYATVTVGDTTPAPE